MSLVRPGHMQAGSFERVIQRSPLCPFLQSGLLEFSEHTMKFKNNSANRVSLSAVGLPDVEPGETVDVPEYLYAPGRTHGGQRAKSTIENVAPTLKPTDAEDLRKWSEMPAPAL